MWTWVVHLLDRFDSWLDRRAMGKIRAKEQGSPKGPTYIRSKLSSKQ
jgi:hypothetical protein